MQLVGDGFRKSFVSLGPLSGNKFETWISLLSGGMMYGYMDLQRKQVIVALRKQPASPSFGRGVSHGRTRDCVQERCLTTPC